ncbi:MAG TPA: acyl-CoA dehydrogenase [Bacteroidales bacterium]|nr:acyl-CoA dehydrogenase [Bacteroidales bacterium]
MNHYTDNKDLKFHLTHPLMKRIVELKERNYIDAETYDYAALDFEDAMDSYDKIMDIVGEICAEIIGPNAEGVDHDGPTVENGRVTYAKGTQENYDALVQAGLVGMTLPRKYKGLNFPLTPYVLAGEMISRADAGFANIWGLQDCAETIHEFASEEQKAMFLPRFNEGATAAMDLTEPDAGSDLQAVNLKATYDEKSGKWILNGVKRFITNGDAEISLVLARSEENTTDARGLSLFIYDKADDAVTVRRIENKLGIKGSPTCELVFKNAPSVLVGDRKLGLIKYVMSLMNGARLGVGAQSVGISEAAYREALKYAAERAQFGKTIDQFPAVYEMLTNMRVKLHAERSLLYETSRYVDMYKVLQELQDEGRKLETEDRNDMKKYRKMADIFTPLLKLISSEYSNQIAYDSLQIHGGTGFMKDFPIERIYRDARITTIYEGTSQLQVVAAIRGVTAGGYLERIREFDAMPLSAEYEFMRRHLQVMTAEYEAATATVVEFKNPEYIDFHARRLVEMAGNIIMGYLLLQDTMRSEEYRISAEIFIKKGAAENNERAFYIKNFSLKDMDLYKA